MIGASLRDRIVSTVLCRQVGESRDCFLVVSAMVTLVESWLR
jgi:hypothetical protein